MGCSHTIIPASEGHLFACPGSRIGSRVRWIRAKQLGAGAPVAALAGCTSDAGTCSISPCRRLVGALRLPPALGAAAAGGLHREPQGHCGPQGADRGLLERPSKREAALVSWLVGALVPLLPLENGPSDLPRPVRVSPLLCRPVADLSLYVDRLNCRLLLRRRSVSIPRSVARSGGKSRSSSRFRWSMNRALLRLRSIRALVLLDQHLALRLPRLPLDVDGLLLPAQPARPFLEGALARRAVAVGCHYSIRPHRTCRGAAKFIRAILPGPRPVRQEQQRSSRRCSGIAHDLVFVSHSRLGSGRQQAGGLCRAMRAELDYQQKIATGRWLNAQRTC